MKNFCTYKYFLRLLTFSKHFPFTYEKKSHKMTFSDCYFDSCSEKNSSSRGFSFYFIRNFVVILFIEKGLVCFSEKIIYFISYESIFEIEKEEKSTIFIMIELIFLAQEVFHLILFVYSLSIYFD